MVNLTEQFIEQILKLCANDLRPQVAHQAKRCVLDYLGSTFAGAAIERKRCERLYALTGQGIGNASLIGFGIHTSAENAAFINGFTSHVAELDDGVIADIVHPGCPVLSTLFPVAQQENVTGPDFLKGVLIGYEVTTRLAEAIQPSHKLRGFHATGTCGMVGAAMGVAAMLGLERQEMKDIFSAAAVSAHGTLKVLEDSSELKPYNVAQAAVNSLHAVAIGRAGFSGPEDVLSGSAGFLAMMANGLETRRLFSDHPDGFAVERV